MNVFKLYGEIKVDDKDAKSKIDGVTKTAKDAEGKMGSSFGNIGESVKKAFTVGAILGFEKQIIGTYSTYDDQMRKVQAVTNATGKEYQALRDKAEELGRSTRFSAMEAGEGMEALGRAGWSTEEVLIGTGQTLTFATANAMDLGDAASIVADGLSQFGMKAEEAGRFTDILSATARESNTDIELLGDTLKYVGPVAGGMGYKLEEVAVAAGLMANNGIKGSAAGTSLRNILTRMAKPTKESATAMEMLGFDIADTEGGMLSFEEILVKLRESMKDMHPVHKANVAAMLAGQQGMSGLLAIVNASDEEFDAMTEAIKNSNGVTQEMADIMDGGLGGAIEGVKSAWEGLLIKLGELQDTLVTDALRVLANVLMALPDKIDFVNEKWGEFKTFLAQNSESVNNFGTTIKETISGIVDFLTEVFSIIFEIVAEFFMGNKEYILGALEGIAKIVEGVMGLIQGILQVILGLIQGDWEMVWNGIKQFVSGIWDGIKGLIQGGLNTIKVVINLGLTAVKTIFELIWNAIKAVVEGIFKAIVGVVKSGINLVKSIIETILNTIKSIWQAIWDVIGDYVKFVWELIKAVVEGAILFVKSIIQATLNIIKAIWDAIWDKIGDKVKNIWDTIKNTIQTAIDAVKGIVDRVMNAIKNTWDRIWNAIKNTTQTVWNNIKSIIERVLNPIKNFISSTMNSIKNTVTNIWNGIKSVTSNIWNSIKSTITNIVNGIKNTVTNVFNAIKSVASNVWNNIKDAMIRPVESARDKIRDILDRIKGFFSNLKLKFPKIEMPPLPHFSLDGEFSLKPPSVPRLAVDWYADGGILTKPTIFGAMGSNLLGGGEAGPEAVLPIEKLSGILAETMDMLGYGQDGNRGDIIQNVTINSPKYLSPAETARENKKALQRLALEY